MKFRFSRSLSDVESGQRIKAELRFANQTHNYGSNNEDAVEDDYNDDGAVSDSQDSKAHKSISRGRHILFDDQLESRHSRNLSQGSIGIRKLSKSSPFFGRHHDEQLKPENTELSAKDSDLESDISTSTRKIKISDQTSLPLSSALTIIRSPDHHTRVHNHIRFKDRHDPSNPETENDKKVDQKVKLVVDFVLKQRIGMMTIRNSNGWLVASSIVIAETENKIDLVFHTNSRTSKFSDIENDPNINLSFQNSDTAEWVSLAGTAKVSTDPKVIDKYLRSRLKDWVGNKVEFGSKPTNVGIIMFSTVSCAYAVSSDFNFTPSFSKRGIILGELHHTGGNGKIEESEIRHFRRRQKYFVKHGIQQS
ncbi:hypothetical protein V1514DRAFT_137377 [Lipomyces japonicus]|uniref:uncharacterized protein n=1 Tax=Lipomyces japonicus TaxID=56871 RepID=UPI0034CD6908